MAKAKSYGLSMADCLDQARAGVRNVPIKEVDEYELKKIRKVDNGIITEEYERVKVDLSERNKGMKSSDFNLTNLLAVGATDLLKPAVINSQNVDAVLDGLDAVVSAIDSIPADSNVE